VADFKQTFLSDYTKYSEKLPSIDYCGGEFISGLSKPTLSDWLTSGEERCPEELKLEYVPYPFVLDSGWRWAFFEEIEKSELLQNAVVKTAPEMETVFVLNGHTFVSPEKTMVSTLHCLN